MLPASLYPQLSDAQLITLTQRGIVTAYDCLVRRYRGAVCLTAAPIVGTDAAQDVAQEVFVTAYYALHQLEIPEKFGGWLRTITRHRAERHARKSSRQQTTDPSVLESVLARQFLSAFSETPEGVYLREERLLDLRRAIAQLSETHREVILLHYLEEWPLARIAGFLSLSEDVVRGRLFRARVALRRLLTHERK